MVLYSAECAEPFSYIERDVAPAGLAHFYRDIIVILHLVPVSKIKLGERPAGSQFEGICLNRVFTVILFRHIAVARVPEAEPDRIYVRVAAFCPGERKRTYRVFVVHRRVYNFRSLCRLSNRPRFFRNPESNYSLVGVIVCVSYLYGVFAVRVILQPVGFIEPFLISPVINPVFFIA